MRVRSLTLVATSLLGALPAIADDLHPDVAGDLTLELLDASLSAPTGGAVLPDGRFLISEQFSGRIMLWDGQGEPTQVGQVTVETGSERGLLGLAVDPEFETSRRIYLYYSTGGAQAAGYALMDSSTDQIDTANITNVITGMAANRNHNGGAITFGPDGYLYLGVGDTGCNCGCAPGTNTSNYFGTCLGVLRGKVLRIDRDGGVPASNPLVGVSEVLACGTAADCGSASQAPNGTGSPRTEIYNWGFRNPWRFAFDEQTGYLWIGDVGEVTNEEVTISTGPGQHHGWPYREGTEGQPASTCAETTPQSGDCKEPAFTYPRSEPPNSQSASITGGVFSNHCSWPEAWRGRYWFGDYAKARVWTLTPNGARDGVVGDRTVVVTGAGGPVHFMRGLDGAIYYLDVNTGTLWRIRPTNPASCEMDAGVEVDAGAPDAAPEEDSGVVPDDSGVVADSGVSPDSGVVADSGVAADSGVGTPDAGTSDTGDDGCRCARGTPVGGFGLAALGLLLIAVRRRR